MTLQMSADAALWFLPFAGLVGMWAAWSDLRHMRIPNNCVLTLLGVFIVIGLVALPLEAFLWRLSHLAVVLVIGFVLSSIGAVGAGDAKFAAAMAPFIALADVTAFLILLAVVTLAAFATHRGLARIGPFRAATSEWVSWTRSSQFPMGFALGPALIFYLALAAAYGG